LHCRVSPHPYSGFSDDLRIREIKEQGVVNYIKHFALPPGAPVLMAPLMFIIEIISHLSRVMSLTLRLFGNIFGEELVIAILFGLVPFLIPLPMMLLGLITGGLQAFIFALLSWTTLAREVRGKVLSLRETDFILAAKEMGASDARIIFLHLYPNTLSHIIVILTLTIPGVILAESFLSFLGIGITEPLISWGLLMRNTQDIQTLGQNAWILSPIIFIVIAVLGFNFMGDGLRDAADPYVTG